MKTFQKIFISNFKYKNSDVLVGYLRASGYFKVREFLDNIDIK